MKTNIKKAQDYVDKFCEEIKNSKYNFNVEKITVMHEEDDAKAPWISASKGKIKICDTSHPFEHHGPLEGALENYLLESISYRVIENINPDFSKEVISHNYLMGAYHSKKDDIFGKIRSFMDIVAVVTGECYEHSNLNGISCILQFGLEAFLASEILAGICSLSQEGRRYIEGKKSWNLQFARKLEDYLNSILKENPNFEETSLTAVRSAVCQKYGWPRTGIGWFIGASPSSWTECVGLNFYLRMAEKDPSLVMNFLKKPYARHDPKLTLNDLVCPSKFVEELAKNRK